MSRPPLRFLAAALAAVGLPAVVAAAVLHVAPDGRRDGTGAADTPFASLAEAAAQARPGDVIRLAPGTYAHRDPVRLAGSGTAEAPISVEAADGKRAVLDFSAQKFEDKLSGVVVAGDHWRLEGLEVTGAARFGIQITGHRNIVARCAAYANQGTGFELSAPASHNLMLDCTSFRNVDRPTRGENADGFGAKFAIGPGNIFRGCRAWENADDGFDFWKAPHPIRVEYCVAYRNGLDLWGIDRFRGNGNGFKLGGDFVAAAHVVVGCVASDQPKNGFDQNNNTAGLTLESCTALNCGYGYSFTLAAAAGKSHVLRDNVGWNAPARLVEGTVLARNRWSSDHRSAVPPMIVESTPVTRQPLNPRPVSTPP